MKNGALSGKAEKIIISLLEHGSIEKAAVAVGVSDVTVWRWMQKPEVQQAYQQARREAFSRSLARLQHASSAAVSTLLRVMVDKDAPAGSRVRAADCVLDHAKDAMETEDIQVRVERLELAEKGKK